MAHLIRRLQNTLLKDSVLECYYEWIYELHKNEKEILDSLDEEDRGIEDEDEIELVECSSVQIVVPKAPTPTPEVINQKVKKLTIKDYFKSKPTSNNL